MSGQVYIPAPRAPRALVKLPHFWIVPCTDGEHELLVSVVLALYEGGPRWFPAICGRNVWPASAWHPAQSHERCGDCPRERKAISPEPVYWGPGWGLMHTLARRLSPRPRRNES